MALISLALPAAGPLRSVLLATGLGGASLFFGDTMIVTLGFLMLVSAYRNW